MFGYVYVNISVQVIEVQEQSILDLCSHKCDIIA